MKFSLARLQELAHGCCEVREDKRGVFFDRMNAALRKIYYGADHFRIRARHPAGVRIVFRSDTAWLKAAFRYDNPMRPFFKADLLVDGALAGSFGPRGPTGGWSGELFRSERRRVRRFELWLPHMVETWIERMEIEDGASVVPVSPGNRVWLTIGDSITQGATAPTPAAAYASIVARSLDLNLRNVGIGGATIEGAVGAAAGRIRAFIASVAFGVNDWNQSIPLDQFRRQAETLLSGLLEAQPELSILVMTPLPIIGFRDKNDVGAGLEDYRAVLRKVVEGTTNATIVEGPALIPSEAGYFVDGLHPNAVGMKIIAKNLLSEGADPAILRDRPSTPS